MKVTNSAIGLIVMLLLFGVSFSWAADATSYSAPGTAKVNDLNMYGKDVVGVGNLDSDTVNTGSITDKDNPAYSVDPNGTSVMNRVQVVTAPTDDKDAVNKAYVDVLEAMILQLKADLGL